MGSIGIPVGGLFGLFGTNRLSRCISSTHETASDILGSVQIIESNAGYRVHGVTSRKRLPPPHDLVAVDRIEFDQARFSVRPFAGDEGGAASPEAVENKVATMRAVANGVGQERNRLDGRMHGEFLKPIRTKCVRASVGPHVATMAPMFPEFDIVKVLTAAMFPNENQFMLATVE